MHSSTIVALIAIYLQGVTADGNDWVNPSFVVQKSGMPNAQQRIVSFAKSTASQGPWTVSGDSSVLPPNGDKRDYLSWAPYHWPECNWCTSGRSHMSTGGNRTDSNGSSGSTSSGPSGDSIEDDGDGSGEDSGDDRGDTNSPSEGENGGRNGDGDGSPDIPASIPISLPAAHRKMMKRVRQLVHPGQKRTLLVAPGDKIEFELSKKDAPYMPSITLPIATGSASTVGEYQDGSTGVQNARKTQKAQPPPKTTSAPKIKETQRAAATKTAASGADCTPSPTKSLPPSATWTDCKYVVRDGHVNPDVRDIPDVGNAGAIMQSVIYNAAAAVFSGSQDYTKSAVQFMQTYFLDTNNGMHPRISYGQLIRGPNQEGQYLGVIDLRGMVKIVNAIQIMRMTKAPAWTSSLDTQMVTWATQYVNWLQTNPLGQKALTAPNNHGTFAANQLAAVNILVQSPSAATAALKSYFTHQFLDQIAASGEQPFEAVRTRPFHYRCFNLEAMITNAKLGDQLGLSFWTTKSKYGATIKDALDFVLAKGPGSEDITDIFPHVAAIAAAYGDPNGKYMAYLRQNDQRFQVAPYYYYDQPGALSKAPTSAKSKSENAVAEVGQHLAELENIVPTPTDAPVTTPTISWECPAAFATAAQVQLDDGVYVTCDELKHFYGYASDAAASST